MRTRVFLSLLAVTFASSACAAGSFRQVSFAGEASPVIDSAGRTVHVVKNTEMQDTALESRIRVRLEEFLLQQGFILSSPETAERYVLATFGSGLRVVGSTAPVFRPADVRVQRSPSGEATGRSVRPDRLEYLRVPSLENSVWLMVLSSDAKHYRETGQIRNLWRGEAAMQGKPESLPVAAGYLMVPALKYFGRGTGQTILLDVREKDPGLK